MPKTIIKRDGWKCLKCGHEWIPKKGFKEDTKPIVCPKCNNPRWEKPKKGVKR